MMSTLRVCVLLVLALHHVSAQDPATTSSTTTTTATTTISSTTTTTETTTTSTTTTTTDPTTASRTTTTTTTETTTTSIKTTTTESPSASTSTPPALTGPCDPNICRLPSCRCPGTDIPGNLSVTNTPMMVMVTFDDEISYRNIHYFDELFNVSVMNPNNCPIKGTFFVSVQTSDFAAVKQIYDRGHEIGSHSRTHRYPVSWWANASVAEYEDEINGMRVAMSENAGIPLEEIRGMRVPFLQIGGDNQFQMLAKNNFVYDSSFITGDIQKTDRPPVWPFTMDYPVDWTICSVEPIPQKSYPGIWEVPIIRFYGNDSLPCAMADSCSPTSSPEMALKYLHDNFNRHYTSNRAPFGIFIHARWFTQNPYAFGALKAFIRELSEMDDVWLVTMTEVIKWIQRPVTISQLTSDDVFACS